MKPGRQPSCGFCCKKQVGLCKIESIKKLNLVPRHEWRGEEERKHVQKKIINGEGRKEGADKQTWRTLERLYST